MKDGDSVRARTQDDVVVPPPGLRSTQDHVQHQPEEDQASIHPDNVELESVWQQSYGAHLEGAVEEEAGSILQDPPQALSDGHPCSTPTDQKRLYPGVNQEQ